MFSVHVHLYAVYCLLSTVCCQLLIEFEFDFDFDFNFDFEFVA